jgi:hypothetical protein
MLERNVAPVPLLLSPNPLFLLDNFSKVQSFLGDNKSASVNLSIPNSPFLNQMDCSTNGANTSFLDSFDATFLPIDSACTDTPPPILPLNGNKLAFAEFAASPSTCHLNTLPTSKPTLLLLGLVQMQTSKILCLDSIIAMVSESFFTPRQGRDMARILFTSQRTGKNIHTSIYLIGSGICPLCHICVDWNMILSSFGQSILHNSPDVIDEIVVDYYSMTVSLLDDCLHYSFFASSLPSSMLCQLVVVYLSLPRMQCCFDKISKFACSWDSFFILRFICEEFV